MEKSAMQSFETLMMDLNSQIEKGKAARTEKSEAKAKALESASGASGDLQDTTVLRDDDTKYLADLSASCAQRQTMRAEEIEAINKAIEILSSGAVNGGA